MKKRIILYLEAFFRTVLRPITRKFYSLFTQLINLPLMLFRKFSSKISMLTKEKETSIKDYVKIFNYYISKKLIILSLLVTLAGSYFGYKFLKQKGFIYSNFYQTEPIKYSGKVRIYDDKKNKNLIYVGTVNKGLLSEYGELFFKGSKQLNYKGLFKNNKFNGFGILYNKNGNVVYKGDFSNGMYSGFGEDFYPNNILKYSGTFKEGKYLGKGKNFNNKGILIYEGIFSENLYEGEGTLYYENKKIVYKGLFKSGVYEGKGELFNASGVKIYEGEFKKGLYDGEGKLFNDSGELLFTGKFKEGNPDTGAITPGKEEELKGFSGSGTIFSSEDRKIKKYEGELKDNKFEGKGILYFEDEKNTVKYEGDFKNNLFDGIGTLYDISKAAIYKGYFKEDNPYPQQFIDKSDAELKAILGQPTNVINSPNGDYTFVYDELNLKFILNKNNDLRILKISSVQISSIINIFNININTKKADIINKLGPPSSTNDSVDSLTNTKTTNLIYTIDKYRLKVSFSESSENPISIELSH